MNLLSKAFPVAALFLSACSVQPDVAMKIEQRDNVDTVLVGKFDGALALVHGDTSKGTVTASNGSLSCSGTSTTGKFSTDLTVNKVDHTFNMQCNDGRTAIVPASISIHGGSLKVTGGGVGTMSDGSTVKLVFGDNASLAMW
ncbi:hypothetical protein [Celeribacter halophilus]|uniref:hypothetical protein n=1 Tax=Celeribacter halophilus TaxID=576117 RepID=UPI003A930D4A